MEVVDFIYTKYTSLYGFPQGFCGQIAAEIQQKLGGDLVAGYLRFRTHDREHWWVDVGGNIVDPMSDDLMATDPHVHIEIHRDASKRYW